MTPINDFDIAIVGMAGRFPGAKNIDEFWANIAGGIESITRLSDEEILAAGVPASALTRPNYVKAAPVLDDPELFDAGFFGFTPAEARTTDPQHRLLLELAQEALDDAGCDPERTSGRIGVFAGSALNTYFLSAGLHGRLAEDYIPTLIGNDKDFLSTRLSYKLNLRGPSLTVQTACSTSLVAVHLACQSLLSGESDLALAGAVAVRVPHRAGYFCDGGGIVSPDGHVRAFDAAANGTVFGSGAGLVVLRRLADALANDDSVRAVIKGSAVNNDGSAKAGYTAPSVDSQADAVMEALANAGIDAEGIGYVEAHGSGTPVGDPIEVRALTKAFRATTQRRAFCALGSVKANVGHLDAAAGIAGLIKTVLALEHGQLPPTPHYTAPNPEIHFAASPFFVNTALREWVSDGPRRAGVMSTGMGGTNAHVVLEEAPPVGARARVGGPHVIPLSARSETALDQVATRLAGFVSENPTVHAGDLAYTLQVGRRGFAYRRCLVANDRDDLLAMLGSGRPGAVAAGQMAKGRRPLVLLLPGLGDHYVGMGAGLYDAWPVFREAVDRCAAGLEPHVGLDIRTLLYPATRSWERQDATPGIDLRRMLGRGAPSDAPDTAALDRTRYAQPALFTVEYATACLWKSLGVVPSGIVGHSMGEYVAACLAGVMSLDDALRVLALRAALVESLPPGAMLAVTLGEAELRPLLPESLSISLINGPQLCVVAGPEEEVARFEQTLEAREVIVRRVRNAHAFHTPMLDPIAPALEEVFRHVALHAPEIPYISNVSGTWITAAEAMDPAYWARHATCTARFGDALERVWQLDDPILLEAGPGRTLGVLAAQHPARPQTAFPAIASSLRHDYENRPDPEVVAQAIGRLWSSGVDIDWEAMPAPGRRKIALPSYPFERQRYWLEAARAPAADDARPPAGGTPVRKREDRTTWLYTPSWKRSMAISPAVVRRTARGAEPGTWLLLADELSFAAALGRELEAAGHRVVTVNPGRRYEQHDANAFAIDPASPADYETLIRALRAEGRTPDHVVHAWAVSEPPTVSSGRDAFVCEQVHGFYSLVYLARALAAHASRGALRLFIFSTHVQDVTCVEPLCASRATLLAPSIVIGQEYPHMRVRQVDLESRADEAGAAAEAMHALGELFTPDSALFVAYRNGQRWIRAYEPVAPPAEGAGPGGFRREGVYLITGGLGDIGIAVSEYLAERYAARLVLTGRASVPGEPERGAWIATHAESDLTRRRLDAIRRIERRGGKVLYAQAEVSDEEAMRQVVVEAERRFGAIHGVIHAAGIVGDYRDIEELGLDGCEPHFLAKAAGTDVLAAIFAGQPLDFILLMSSLTSVLGGIGHSAQTASNFYLDAFALARSRAGGSPWMSVNWDFWRLHDDRPGASPLGTTVRDVGMSAAEAMAMLEVVIGMRGVPQLLVSTGDLDARIHQWLDFEPVEARQARAAPGAGVPVTAAHADGAQRDDLEGRVARIWEAILGIPRIGVNDSFADLGGHSLLAVRIVGELRQAFQVNLPVRSLFDAPTVAELAVLIREKIVAEIEAMSEEEAGRLATND